jgi:hypothetical protein
MWKKILTVGAVLAGVEAPAQAFWGAKKQPAVAMPSGVLQAFRSSAADPWGVGRSPADFSHPVFATPLPPGPGRVAVPCGGPLVTPVITPLAATNPGHLSDKFEVIPAGWDQKAHLTKHPEKYVDDDSCECGPRNWANFEFLYWATQGVSPSPVVTTGPSFAAPGIAGALGQVTTIPLFGAHNTLNQFRPGFRTEVGHWFASNPTWGASARFYFLGAVSEQFLGGSNGTNVLSYNQAIPTPLGPVPFPLYVAYPGLTVGSTSASVHSNFLGGDVNLRHRLTTRCAIDLDVIGGYRVTHLGDNLVASFDIQSAAVPAPVGPHAVGEDRVSTQNQFHGGQVGFAATGRHGPFTFGLQSTVALGVTVSDLDDTRIRAFSPGLTGAPGVGLVPVIPVVLSGGGQQNEFAVVPEVGITLGWQASERLRLTAGYNCIYWSHVRRAQAVYDLTPAPAAGTTDFWAQGINGGFELRY